MEMKHFAHQHPLTLLNEEEEQYCFGCRKPILFSTTGPSYICKTCNSFRLHKSCAELPSKIHRIAHPDHPLTICRGMRNCSACHLIRGEIMYECRDKVYCMFCALFPETIEHTSHEHPLILQMKESCFICDACDRSEQGMSYHCASCIFSISSECSSLPTTFQYNCHHHPLTLVGMFRLDEELSKFRIDCDICRRKVKESSCVYHCAKCLYVAHVDCATKGLNGSEGSVDKGQDHSPRNETSHKKAVEAHSPENSSTILCMPAPDRCIRYQRTPHCNHSNISSFQHITSPRRQIMKIDSLPTSVACSICSRGTNAIGGGDFWCNYCNDKVSLLTKVKFGLRITDPTGSIDAVMFADVAEKFFNSTAAEIEDNQYR